MGFNLAFKVLTQLHTFPRKKYELRTSVSSADLKYTVQSSRISEPASSAVIILRYVHKHPFKDLSN